MQLGETEAGESMGFFQSCGSLIAAGVQLPLRKPKGLFAHSEGKSRRAMV